MYVASALLIAVIGAGIFYLWLLALSSIRNRRSEPSKAPELRFAIAIPAHDEEAVIGSTLPRLRRLDYPQAMYDIFVVADHCTDRTAEIAREQGAICYERGEGPRGSKGAALAWLLERILAGGDLYDAVAIFDSDTQVDSAFLRVMDARLARGDAVVQGCHRVSNPGDGWFPALTWAMFMIDNRFQNQGRSNLGFSAKLMGDSVCFRADLLRRLGWSAAGLTEDYEFRLRLLLEGVRICYEPAAIGYGEAPVTWAAARAQRARWLRGSYEANRRYGWTLLREGLRRGEFALLDGAAQCILPPYSTLTLISMAVLMVHLALWPVLTPVLTYSWAVVVFLLAVYPLLGLALERAPPRAYLAILSGPAFIVWRTWLSLVSRFGSETVTWVRTEHGAHL
jgi:1,2-diacylglycerol 3-beta-glucosyltransferase